MKGRKRLFNRVCSNCGSDKTWTTKHGIQNWHKHDGDKYYCHRCYTNLVLNPKHAAGDKLRRLTFKDTRLYLKQAPRKGICSWCGKKIGDTYIGWRNKTCVVNRTVMHHIKYHPEDPSKDTVEICVSCHNKEHRRLKSN